jgi:hypothetical protein
MGTTFTPGVITWNWLGNQTLWACGCLEIPAGTSNNPPRTLLRWCGQPDCLRLFQANVAYDARQYAWQTAHGGTPTLVAALLRPMVTPLPQILPPPSGTQYFMADIMAGDVVDITGQEAEPESAAAQAHKAKSGEPEKKPPQHPAHPGEKPPERPPQKQEPPRR